MNENKKAMLKKLSITVLSLFFIFYVSYQVYLTSFDKVETYTALEKTANNSLFTKGFFVREEEYIINSASGTVIPIAKDGKKVSSGNAVAVEFDSDDAVATYMRIQTLKAELERYIKLNSITPSSGLALEGMETAIDRTISDLVDTINAGELDNLGSYYSSVRDAITKKQLLMGENIAFQDIIDGINAELEHLEKKNVSYRSITANGSGYYIANVDGFENAYSYAEIKNILPAEVDSLLEGEKAKVPDDVMGKLVTGFKWYIVCKLEIKNIAELEPGAVVTIEFPYSSTQPLEARVEAVNVSGADTAAVVLSCNVMDEELANMRIEDIEIIFDSVSGFRVPTEAVREVDGVKGVFILRSNTVTFREINIIWSGEEYVICADDELRLYDEIITKGKDLYDGKAIN
ncbi:MAG: hypothetical protein IJA02_06680 [Clostridia bacterium]|nr:hypothetical protein [Clostridia bacterium]